MFTVSLTFAFIHSLTLLVPHICIFLLHLSGIGVPIMLAYVYGVVPISLCRSGGCGVSAGNGKGVRIEFDDENDMNAGSGAPVTGTFYCCSLICTGLDTQNTVFMLKIQV